MRKIKDILTECFPDLILSDATLKQLQGVLNEMLIDIDKIARENNLHCQLAYGTLLGAARHKGFIPWDDDVDLMMLREEYEKLREILVKDYSHKYDVETPNVDKTIHKSMKIYLKGTKYVEINTENVPMNKAIFLDIFPIDNAPTKYKLREILYFVCTKASSVALDFWYPSKTILKKCKENKELKSYYRKRRLLGFIVSFLSPFAWTRLSQKFAIYKKDTKKVLIPSNLTYFREVYDKQFLTDLVELEFEGKRYYVPKDFDLYLQKQYGDYMQIPPEEKRERHIASEIVMP